MWVAAVNAFIAVYLLSLWAWVPGLEPVAARVRALLGPIADLIGNTSVWAMYAQEPRYDVYLEAEIRRRSGKVARWRSDRFELLPGPRAFALFRRQAWMLNVFLADDKPLWDALARYVASESADRQDPATRVSLFMLQKPIPSPEDARAIARYDRKAYGRVLLSEHRLGAR